MSRPTIRPHLGDFFISNNVKLKLLIEQAKNIKSEIMELENRLDAMNLQEEREKELPAIVQEAHAKLKTLISSWESLVANNKDLNCIIAQEYMEADKVIAHYQSTRENFLTTRKALKNELKEKQNTLQVISERMQWLKQTMQTQRFAMVLKARENSPSCATLKLT